MDLRCTSGPTTLVEYGINFKFIRFVDISANNIADANTTSDYTDSGT